MADTFKIQHKILIWNIVTYTSFLLEEVTIAREKKNKQKHEGKILHTGDTDLLTSADISTNTQRNPKKVGKKNLCLTCPFHISLVTNINNNNF